MVHRLKILIQLNSAVAALAPACLLVGCKPDAITSSTSDTGILEIVARSDPRDAKFANDVKKFYAALAAHDWDYTYNGRTDSFKKSVPRALYLSTVSALDGKISSFSYEVLAHDDFILNGVERKRLIMKFDLGAMRPEYSVVWWKFEDDQWRCDEVGIRSIPFFNRFRAQEE